LEKYKAAAEKLLAGARPISVTAQKSGWRIYALNSVKNKLPPGYDRCCRNLTPETTGRERKEELRRSYVLKPPLQGKR